MCCKSKRPRRSGIGTASNTWYVTSNGIPLLIRPVFLIDLVRAKTSCLKNIVYILVHRYGRTSCSTILDVPSTMHQNNSSKIYHRVRIRTFEQVQITHTSAKLGACTCEFSLMHSDCVHGKFTPCWVDTHKHGPYTNGTSRQIMGHIGPGLLEIGYMNRSRTWPNIDIDGAKQI